MKSLSSDLDTAQETTEFAGNKTCTVLASMTTLTATAARATLFDLLRRANERHQI